MKLVGLAYYSLALFVSPHWGPQELRFIEPSELPVSTLLQSDYTDHQSNRVFMKNSIHALAPTLFP